MRSLSWLFLFTLLADPGRVVNFDTAPFGKLPSGWTAMPAAASVQWEIRKDPTAATQPYVLAQASAAPSGIESLVILDNPAMRNGDVSVRLKPVSGAPRQEAGLVFAFRDNDNYYLAEANARTNSVALIKVEAGKRRPLVQPARHEMPENAWRILKVAVRGRRIQVYVDHRRVLQADAGAASTSGKTGLWTAPGAATNFDDFRLLPK